MQLAAGTLLHGGKYRIERVLGQGGFGITYMASDTRLDKTICIKEFFMREYCDRDADTSHISVVSEGAREQVERYKAKFVKEARLISSMSNPNIITIYDIFDDNGTVYYTMDYLEGGSLKVRVDTGGPLNESKALDYVGQIGNALKYMHSRNVTHLDVKPSNIMLDSSGKAVLIDFGISKRYDSSGGQTSSTPVGISKGYAPMEQYNAAGVGSFSPETDVYSLGATLYFLLVGRPPQEATIVNEEGLEELPKTVSRKVRHVIVHAMQPRRKDRPGNIAAFLHELGLDRKENAPIPGNPVATDSMRGGPSASRSSSAFDWFLWAVYPMLWGCYMKQKSASANLWLIMCSPVMLLVVYPFVCLTFGQSLMSGTVETYLLYTALYGSGVLLLVGAVIFSVFLYKESEKHGFYKVHFITHIVCSVLTFSFSGIVSWGIFNLFFPAVMAVCYIRNKSFSRQAYISTFKWLATANTVCMSLFTIFVYLLLLSGFDS